MGLISEKHETGGVFETIIFANFVQFSSLFAPSNLPLTPITTNKLSRFQTRFSFLRDQKLVDNGAVSPRFFLRHPRAHNREHF